MDRQAINVQRLTDYCKKHNIAIPSPARREQIEAAIARAMLHDGEVEPDPEIGCFGNWSEHDKNCNFCDFEQECYKASLGTDRKKYNAFIEKIENPQVRFMRLKKKDRARKAKKK